MPTNPNRSNLCHFTFADGRRCALPQFPDDLGLCYYHGKQYRQHLKALEVGRDIAHFFQTEILTNCDITAALGALFAATAQGHIKPKTATALAYLAQVITQNQQLAKGEFLESSRDNWRKVVRNAPAFQPPARPPAHVSLRDANSSAQSASDTSTGFASVPDSAAPPGSLPTDDAPEPPDYLAHL